MTTRASSPETWMSSRNIEGKFDEKIGDQIQNSKAMNWMSLNFFKCL